MTYLHGHSNVSNGCTVGLICIFPPGVVQKDPPRGARVEKGIGGRASPCSRLERERPDSGSLGTGTGAGTGGEERLGDLDKRGVVADQLSRPACRVHGAAP